MSGLIHDGTCAAVPDLAIEAAARAHQRELTKPLGSLGRLEDIACWLAARWGTVIPQMPRSEIFVFAADHGVASRGVSAYPQNVTEQMLLNFAHGGAAINVIAPLVDARVEVVDAGVASERPTPPGIRNERIAPGTHDLANGPAMSIEQAEAALALGERCVKESAARGANLLIAGDMGIGNTTAAACLISAFTGAPAANVVGRGTGVDDEALARKRVIVEAAVARWRAKSSADLPLQTLAELGGLELAAMAGFYVAAARNGIPVLLDGYLSAAAALVAVALDPGAREWMLASHRSAEAGHAVALQALELSPLLDLGLRLGEGTGAALALSLVRAAVALHRDMATFTAAGVSKALPSGA
jgi:nicotinate-nucleotide--dimethylbenzimidazole phosphoribosyltransferase